MAIKVCHMTSTHLPKDQRIFHKECVSLANGVYDVYLVEQGENEEEKGVHIIGTGEQKKNTYYRLLVRPFCIYRLAKKINAEIYHFHDMELLPYGVLLKKKKKKVIFDCHEDFASRFEESESLFGPKWLKKLMAKVYSNFEIWALKKMDAVISVTPHICNRLEKINPHTYMITNYPFIVENIEHKIRKYDVNSEYIAFAGQVSDVYNISSVVEALQTIEKIEFKVCGPLKKISDLKCFKQLDKNNLLTYIGMLPYMDVFQFINGARAAVALPEYSINTAGKLGTLGSNKLFEAMAGGVPVICTDYILWENIIQKYRCGICVNPNDRNQIRDAVKFILHHPDEAAEMGRRGREAVKKEFNWNTQEKVLLDVYSRLI